MIIFFICLELIKLLIVSSFRIFAYKVITPHFCQTVNKPLLIQHKNFFNVVKAVFHFFEFWDFVAGK